MSAIFTSNTKLLTQHPAQLTSATPPIILASVNSKLFPGATCVLESSTNYEERAQSSSDSEQHDLAAAAPSQEASTRRMPSAKSHAEERFYEGMMGLKYKEHELEMKIKETNYQCSEMEKELKAISKNIIMNDFEVNNLKQEFYELSISNKKLERQILRKEKENADEKEFLIRAWNEAANAVKCAAIALREAARKY